MTHEFARTISDWARTNAPTEWQHDAPYVWWRCALTAGVITEQDYENARKHYGNLWDYCGD